METPNIEIKFGYNTVQVLGDQNGVTGALVRHSGGEELVIDATGFFLAIGHTPNTAVFKGALELDAEGYIRTEPGTSRTSVPGVFAAGDRAGPALPAGDYGGRVGLYGRARLRALSAGAVIGGVVIDLQALFRIGDDSAFERAALDVFRFQAERCEPYREYLRLIGIRPERVETTREIPFLPIELFKTRRVYCSDSEPQQVFTSSSTTGQTPAKHYVADLSIYERAFTLAFERFYGSVDRMAIFALLPNYLEREGSSLIYMADRLIRQGGGGFYLHDHDALLRDLHAHRGPKILLGVSYALWDLADRKPGPLPGTIVMETGGMKGRPARNAPRGVPQDALCGVFGAEHPIRSTEWPS